MSKTSAQLGNYTSACEVTNISRHGFWLSLRDRELFLSFADFPWFEEAPIAKILNVAWPTEDHLYWPELDVDISISSIEHPEKFPLKSRGA
jgi:hypothetical protein